MAEPEPIVSVLNSTVCFDSGDSVFKGKKVLITAGPTYEPLDPIRFIGNHSSGKMGVALAEFAYRSGAEVQLILGPSNVTVPDGINVKRITSASEMYKACKTHFEKADICIFAAAV